MGIPLNFKDVSDEGVGVYPDAFVIKETLCVVVNPEEKVTTADVQYLEFGLVVAEGEFDSKFAGKDKLFFHTDKAMERSMFVLRRLGQPVDDGDFILEAERLRGVKVRVTTELERGCNETGCFGKVSSVGKDNDGNVIWACQKCEWRGTDPFTRARPAYAGYEFAGADDKPSEGAKSTADIRF